MKALIISSIWTLSAFAGDTRDSVMDEENSPCFEPGTKVELRNGAEGERSEFGVVVHCWRDNEIKAFDCYVAFFGNRFPVGKPEKAPYVLRYAATSLKAVPKN